jgi:hypothetical protein
MRFLLRDAHQPIAPADVPLSGLCCVQTGVKFQLPPFESKKDLDADA